MLRQGQGERVPCKEQYQQHDVTQDRGRQPPSGWILNLSHPFAPVYSVDQLGIKGFFCFLSFFALRFSLRLSLGFFFVSLLPLSFFPVVLMFFSFSYSDSHL